MAHDFFFPLLAAVFALASWGMVILSRHLNGKNRIRERELLHKERGQAMQGDVATQGSLEPADLTGRSEASPAQVLAWFRVAALCVGFFLTFGGIGMLLAFGVNDEYADIFSIGWIPVMAGTGLLVFYRLSRNLGSQFADD